jgi:2-polyprenyl-3-methyl-5-hydroxy-6-metoxy-1,4-benzoquinol methylase
MNTRSSKTAYVLGSADAEHERLIRQGAWLAPITERLFRAAGIGPGHRVLDIGCGVGEVSLLTARLVGRTGEVIGVDRDAVALAKARSRAAGAGMDWVRFTEADLSDLSTDAPFDAVVGRFVLMFLPSPVTVMRGLAAKVRPGGVLVFQEASWPSLLAQLTHLQLWSSCAALMLEILKRSGVRTDNALGLFHDFQDIGLPPPEMRLEVPVGPDPYTRRWLAELLLTVRPRLQELGLSEDAVGDFNALADRLEQELDRARSFGVGIGLVGAWARTPVM